MKKIEISKELKLKIKHIFNYVLVGVGMIICFILGYYVNSVKDYGTIEKPQEIKRSNVIIATDETSNILFMDRTGSKVLMIMNDSVVDAIFNIRAKSMLNPVVIEPVKGNKK